MSNLPWPSKTIREICEKPQYGFTASATAQRTGTHFLRITDLRGGRLNWEDVPYCECSRKEGEQFKVHSGDLVVARIGATTGKTSLILNPPDAVFASYLIRLRPKESLNPFFLYFFTHSASYNAWINGNKGNNLKGGVSASLLTEISVPLPPKGEQEKIAAILWKTQRAAELEEKLAATARELRSASMQRLFSSGLRGERQKETEIGLVPKSWNIRSLGDLCTISTGGTPSKARPDFWQGSIPWVSPKDLKRPRLNDVVDHISEEALDSGSNLAPAGTILIVVRGMILVRDVPIALLERPMAFNQDLKALVSRGDIQPDYLLYALTAFKSQLFQKIGMSAHGTRTLVGTSIADTCLPVPPGEEQRAIAVALQTIDRKIAVHERRAAILRELFASLLHRLMTGEVRVDKLDIDVSEVRA